MIHARIQKKFPAGPESAGFSLDLDLRLESGVTVLFGPSGAGKTLTLGSIAGFVTPDGGRILLDDRIVFDAEARVNLSPRQRRCGYVFQNYALFPHMTLRQNLEFAAVSLPRLERHRRVNEALERFALGEVAGRHPSALSGGQQQRCSIARALVAEPRILLLDEPARGLDAPLREDLYAVIRQVRDDFQVPILLVTHSIEECFALADQLLLVVDGRIAHSGTPREVLEKPLTSSIARLLGIANLLAVEIVALDPGRNTSRLRLGTWEFTGPYFPGCLRGDRIRVCFDAHDVRLLPAGSKAAPNQRTLAIRTVSPRRNAMRLLLDEEISVDLPLAVYETVKDSEEVTIEVPSECLRAVKPDDGPL